LMPEKHSGRAPAMITPPQAPEGVKRGRLRTARYVQALGFVRGGWLSLREAFGDRRLVSVRYRGKRLKMRLNTTDILVLYSVFQRQDYGLGLVPGPATIIDAGAYTGFSTVYFAEKYPAATILALEPDPSNYALLVDNARAYPNVIPLNMALWHCDCQIGLRDRGTGHWAFFVDPGESGAARPRTEVEAVTLRTLIDRFGVERVDLLKIDVEGAEKEIFEHAGDWIERVNAIFAELHDRLKPGCSEAFARITASFGRVFTDGMTVYAIREAPVEPGPVGAVDRAKG